MYLIVFAWRISRRGITESNHTNVFKVLERYGQAVPQEAVPTSTSSVGQCPPWLWSQEVELLSFKPSHMYLVFNMR